MGFCSIDIETPEPAPIDLTMLFFAGFGSLADQRAARDSALALAGRVEAPLGEALTAAEMFGWMVLRSDDFADYRCLAGILVRRAEELAPTADLKSRAYAQALNILDVAADAGDALSLDMLASLSERVPDEARQQVATFREDWDRTRDQLRAAIAAASETPSANGKEG